MTKSKNTTITLDPYQYEIVLEALVLYTEDPSDSTADWFTTAREILRTLETPNTE